MITCKINSQNTLLVLQKPQHTKCCTVYYQKKESNFELKKLKVGALFMVLSKEFDTLDQSLTLAKLTAYGFDNN